MIQNTENSKERISIPQNPNALTIRKNDRNKIIFGSVLTLHTFDRDLKWNPHILCLVCEEAFDTQKNKMKNFSFISYEKLRKTWMYQVLDLLSKQKIKNFRYLKQKLYEELVNGFYVYAKKEKRKMMMMMLMIALITFPDIPPNLPWLKTTSSNMKMIRK